MQIDHPCWLNTIMLRKHEGLRALPNLGPRFLRDFRLSPYREFRTFLELLRTAPDRKRREFPLG